MTAIAIVTSTVRPDRVSSQVADWVLQEGATRAREQFEIIDIAGYDLPVWAGRPGEPPPSPQGREFAQAMARFDGYVFVLAEYNHSVPSALKNALDHLQPELHTKAAAIVSYGSAMGARAAEHLRGILSEYHIAHVRESTLLSIFHDFHDFTDLRPTPFAQAALSPMLDRLGTWSRAMSAIRSGDID